ncbi:MAG: hypothetical protein J6A59_18740 [Lachnospiraceae bacterium]|nr:hypothetical protein [Lachnospiraceae bacterium]
MSFYNVTNNDYFSSFFGNTGVNGTSSNNNFLGDYYAVQNGSYYKLAKKFYANSSKDETEGAKVDEKSIELVKSSAQEAINSLNKLMDDSLFKKVEMTDKDGNKVVDYDKDKILDKLKTFVEDYNSLVEDAGEMDGDNSLKAGVRMVDQLKVYRSSLAQIGINNEGDNTLKIDEEAFKTADMTDVKSLFTGNVSMAKNMQSKLLQVYSATNVDLNSTSGLYSSQAIKNVTIGNMFDSLL